MRLVIIRLSTIYYDTSPDGLYSIFQLHMAGSPTCHGNNYSRLRDNHNCILLFHHRQAPLLIRSVFSQTRCLYRSTSPYTRGT